MGASVVWFEIAGNDMATLERFYGQLLGWKLNTDNPTHYGLVDTGAEGGIPGGIYAPGGSVGQYVSFYADVKDLDKSLAQAEQLGGKVVQPPMLLDGGARVGMILDPEGHRIGLIQQPETPPVASS